MTPELIELGRRAVACKAWEWMPGAARRYHSGKSLDRTTEEWNPGKDGSIPDFSDPATIGCLLALVEAHNTPAFVVACEGYTPVFGLTAIQTITELVQALEEVS